MGGRAHALSSPKTRYLSGAPPFASGNHCTPKRLKAQIPILAHAWPQIDGGGNWSIMGLRDGCAKFHETRRFLTMVIITDECIECGSCAEVCPEEAISPGDGIYVIDQELCIECLSCLEECPTEAIIEK
jgi:ferredoxin